MPGDFPRFSRANISSRNRWYSACIGLSQSNSPSLPPSAPELSLNLLASVLTLGYPANKVPADERAKLVQELLALIKGKVMDIALKHDASRVVQTALQFGNREVIVR